MLDSSVATQRRWTGGVTTAAVVGTTMILPERPDSAKPAGSDDGSFAGPLGGVTVVADGNEINEELVDPSWRGSQVSKA